MKYCISGRQPLSTLKEADEIKMKYEDRERAIDYIQAFPEKTIIITIPKDIEDIEWKLLDVYNESCTLVLCLESLNHVNECNAHNVKFYWAYPITSYYELRGILNLNPYYIFLGAPLCFDLETVQSITGVYIRLVANVAYDAYIPREDGICGQWIRPEDVKYYEPYVNALEFNGVDLAAERTLLHVYKDNQNWPGNLNLLLKNLNYNIDNRALPDEIGPIRIRCGQRCMRNGACHYCHSAFKFADALRKKHYELKAEDNN